ncbi:MAG TPA: FAD-binding protein [Polyangiaceae bacterium]
MSSKIGATKLARTADARELASDFGGIFSKTPRRILTARAGLEKKIGEATRRQQELSVRGAGHSCMGQSLSRDVLLASYRPEAARVRQLDDRRFEVDSWASWDQVERALNRADRTFPVLTDYLALSVGGTLSVGGIGLNSLRAGLQIDHVESIELVTPSGQRLTCDRDRNRDYFELALAGLGQVGWIERVILRTSRLERYTSVSRRRHESISEMIDFIEFVTSADCAVQHYSGFILNDVIASEFGAFGEHRNQLAELSAIWPSTTQLGIFEDYPFVMEQRRRAWLAQYPDSVRLWTDYVFPIEQARAFGAYMEERLRDREVSEFAKAIYVLVISRQAAAVPFALAPTSGSGTYVGFGWYNMVSRWDPLKIETARACLKAVLGQCIALGGRPYLYGFNELDEQQRTLIYGEPWRRLSELRSASGWQGFNAHAFK